MKSVHCRNRSGSHIGFSHIMKGASLDTTLAPSNVAQDLVAPSPKASFHKSTLKVLTNMKYFGFMFQEGIVARLFIREPPMLQGNRTIYVMWTVEAG